MADTPVFCLDKDPRAATSIYEDILSSYPKEPRFLLPILLDIQQKYRYLPVETMKEVAEYLDVPETRVFSLATFYKAFSLTPRGEKTIRVCAGTACHLRGGASIQQQIENALGIRCGETTEDGRFTLEKVNCLGACALAPVMMVDDRIYGKVTPRKALEIIGEESADEPE